ncbi:SusC/RagA family TonB-linked outer membrane protein [uncultured Duncaniella sp.]|uniref:SusC/RagA family TonB-linked outer membrane protein n=1 Tax=uncultured Duncaniella sp. TaxID=2768039 RepID=UPI0026587231|nr:SusC/RagA family TonB-linked outer membrane protein [uncultured Duncaniella sp.]
MVIIAIASLMCATVSAQTKNVSLHTKEMKLENILQKMRKENPGYKFLFNHEEIKNRGQKDIDLHNVPIDSALSVILQGTGLTYSIEKNIIVIRPITSARSENTQLTVSGKVIDSTGEPLAGVSVIIASTHEGCATDVNGLFNIKVPDAHSVLMFSMIGMEPQAQMVGEQRVMNIIMHEITNMISEVVVTGYQDIKKEKMTGSVTTINAEKLKDRYTPNILDNLEGRVAGLSTYGGRPIIRGTGTLHASTSPLLVVDGLPIEGSLSDLNPYDIESINVLKDAAAAAIYGARASNGIIVITTKNARKNDKIDIDFSANLTIYENLNVDYADNHYMTPEQQVDLESNYYDYYFFNNDGEISDPIKNTASAISLGHMISPVRNAYYQRALGNISQTDLESTLSSLKNNNFALDYAKAVLRRQVLQQYNLALRGSTEKMHNNLVINYKKDNAGRINNYNNWLNIYYKGSYDLTSWLTATVSINGIYNKKRDLGSNATAGYDDIWSMPSYTQLYNDDSTIRPIYYRYSGNEY